jgi:serine protease DegS
MGVSVQPIISKTGGADSTALLVTQTVNRGPADKAGINPGDVITAINNEPVTDGRIAMHRVALLRPGDIVNVTLTDPEQGDRVIKVVLGSLQQSQAVD